MPSAAGEDIATGLGKGCPRSGFQPFSAREIFSKRIDRAPL